jgi:hypothetical protein
MLAAIGRYIVAFTRASSHPQGIHAGFKEMFRIGRTGISFSESIR